MSKLMVPMDLWRKAESLSAIGVDERAWHPEDAVRVVESLRGTDIAVLGGDVYVKRVGRFEPSYENWYAEREPQEFPSAFATRSQSVACGYLAKMLNSSVGEQWVTLVLSEPMEPLEE